MNRSRNVGPPAEGKCAPSDAYAVVSDVVAAAVSSVAAIVPAAVVGVDAVAVAVAPAVAVVPVVAAVVKSSVDRGGAPPWLSVLVPPAAAIAAVAADVVVLLATRSAVASPTLEPAAPVARSRTCPSGRRSLLRLRPGVAFLLSSGLAVTMRRGWP